MGFNRSLAIVLGINQYENGIPTLSTAVNDATALATLLGQEHGYETLLLLDEQVTGKSLRDFLRSLKEDPDKRLGPDDRLLLYFAGHGVAMDGDEGPVGYLIPQEASRNDAGSFFAMADLNDLLSQLSCRHLLVILDCCFAGAFRWSSTRELRALPEIIHRERYARFIEDQAWQVITSSAYDQKAADVLAGEAIGQRSDGQSHSPFGRALFQALKGDADIAPRARDGRRAGDGVITATELYLYLRYAVESENVSRSRRQTPSFWPLKRHDKGEYIFLVPGAVLDLPPAPELTTEKNPYRGLESYDENQRDLFFGRKQITKSLSERVIESFPGKTQAWSPFVVVLGASGTGKSSVVKAGLIPALRQLKPDIWHIPSPLRPGELPLKSLAQLMAETDGQESETINTQKLLADNMALASWIETWLVANPQKVFVLVIDQLEELFTICQDRRQRKRFLQSLARAVSKNPERFRIVMTLRSDFEPQLAHYTRMSYWNRSRFMITPMTQDELREVIEEPAAVRVLYFKPASVVDRLINEVVQMPGALPLLSFTLSELYLKYVARNADDRTLTESDYEKIGGVIGSLRQRANEEYEKLTPLERETMRRVMLRMVATESNEPARRRVRMTELQYSDHAENQRVTNVIQRLLAARLIVKGGEAEGESYVEPAHDALVNGWDKLWQWIRDARKGPDNLALQRRLTQATNDWVGSERDKRQLWDDDPRLPQLEQIRISDPYSLSDQEDRFIVSSGARRTQIRRRKFMIGAGLVASLIFMPVLILLIWQRTEQANDQSRIANARKLANQSNLIRAQQGNLLPTSALFAVAAMRQYPSLDADQALRQSLSVLPLRLASMSHESKVNDLAFSPDGNYLATASEDGSVQLWSVTSGLKVWGQKLDRSADHIRFSKRGKYLAVANGEIVTVWEAASRLVVYSLKHEGDVLSVDFSSDESLIATGGYDKNVRVWNSADGRLLWRKQVKKPVVACIFSPDGKYLVAATFDFYVLVLNKANGGQIRSLKSKVGLPLVVFSPDGKQLVTASAGEAQVWETSTWRRMFMVSHGTYTSSLAFSPDGTAFATGGPDGFVRFWSAPDGQDLTNIRHGSEIKKLSFSPDGSFVASVGTDNMARVWSKSDGREVARMCHVADVNALAFNPSGESLATASSDKLARIWESVASFERPANYKFSVESVTLSADGKYIASKSADRSARIQETATGKVCWRKNFRGEVLDIKFSANGEYFAIASLVASPEEEASDRRSIVEILRVVDRQEVETLRFDSVIRLVTFSRDSKSLATVGDDHTLVMWDTTHPSEMWRVKIESAVTAMAVSPDGRFVATVGDVVSVRKTGNGEVVQEFKPGQQIAVMAFAPDGSSLALGGGNGGVFLLNVISGQQRQITNYESFVVGVDISLDGRYLTSADFDGSVILIELLNGKQVATLKFPDTIMTMAVSPDARYVAAGGNNMVRILELRSGQEVARIVHGSEVKSLVFSRDGQYLATGSADNTARLSLLCPEDLIAESCDRLTAHIVSSEWEEYTKEQPNFQSCVLPSADSTGAR